LFLQEQQASTSASAKPNPFGTAKPREDVLIQKGVDPKAVEEKIEAKIARAPRLSKEQQEEVDSLQAAIDAASDSADADEKKKEMEALLTKFKEMSVVKVAEKPKFIRPSERRAQRELEGGGSFERQGDFSNFGGRSGGGVRDARPGDWPCASCNANNFASRNSCFKCNEPRGASGSGGYGGGRSSGGGGGNYERQGDFRSFGGRGGQSRVESRPGDWPCASCSANNFASRNSCFKCNEPRG